MNIQTEMPMTMSITPKITVRTASKFGALAALRINSRTRPKANEITAVEIRNRAGRDSSASAVRVGRVS